MDVTLDLGFEGWLGPVAVLIGPGALGGSRKLTDLFVRLSVDLLTDKRPECLWRDPATEAASTTDRLLAAAA